MPPIHPQESKQAQLRVEPMMCGFQQKMGQMKRKKRQTLFYVLAAVLFLRLITLGPDADAIILLRRSSSSSSSFSSADDHSSVLKALPTAAAAAAAASQIVTSQEEHQIGWWTPWVRETSTVYRPRSSYDSNNNDWCFPNTNFSKNIFLPEGYNGPIRGLIYIKSHKASSSTCTGINWNIARNVAKRRKSRMDGNSNSKTTTETCCEHHDSHLFHNHKSYAHRRDLQHSLMWTFVRHPKARDLSQLYHFHVTWNGIDPNDMNNNNGDNNNTNTTEYILQTLRSFHSRQTKYLTLKRNDLDGMKLKQMRAIRDYNSNISISAHTTYTNMMTLAREKVISEILHETIFNRYDFIGVTERMAESLAVMTLLWEGGENGVEPTDVIVLNAKLADGHSYDAGGHYGQCFQLVPPPRQESEMNPKIAAYLNSAEAIEGNMDYLLYYAAHDSLDRTIEVLGKERVRERTKLIQQLQALAEERCSDSAIFPCSSNKDGGVVDQKDLAAENCYFADSACGYPCVDRVLLGK